MKHLSRPMRAPALFILFSLLVSACGGGGGTDTGSSGGNNSGGTGGGNYSISINKNSLEFTGTSDGNVSAGILVRVTYKGDGVLVGFPPSVQEVNWINVSTQSYTDTTANISVSAYSNQIGTHTTTLRFITGKEDGSATRYVDLPVTLTITEAFGSYSEHGQFDFMSTGRNPANVSPSQPYTINVYGADSQWTVNAESWISVNTTSGSGPATLSVSVDPSNANYGENTGTVQLTDAVSGNVMYHNVYFRMDHAEVSVDTSEHFFAVLPSTNAADLTATFTITDELQGNSPDDVYAWELVSSSAEWLSLSTDMGTTAAGEANPEIIIDKDLLLTNAVGERYEAELTLRTSSDFATAEDHIIKVSTFIASAPIAVTGSTANNFDFTINRAAHSNNKLYLADTNDNRVYVVDATSGETEWYYAFPELPETVYVSPDGSRLYVALLIQEHDYFQNEPAGKIAVIDLESGLLINKFGINSDPWDLVATDAGEVYVVPGSGQWVELHQYDAETGSILLSSGSLRHRSQIILAPAQDEVFTVTTDSSPSDITRYYPLTIDGYSFLADMDSPYHGDYRIWSNIWIEPSGNNILSEGGDLFSRDGLIYVQSVLPQNTQILDLAYDTTEDRAVYIDTTGSVASYDLPNYDNYQVISNGLNNPQFVFTQAGQVLVIDNTETGFQLIKP